MASNGEPSSRRFACDGTACEARCGSPGSTRRLVANSPSLFCRFWAACSDWRVACQGPPTAPPPLPPSRASGRRLACQRAYSRSRRPASSSATTGDPRASARAAPLGRPEADGEAGGEGGAERGGLGHRGRTTAMPRTSAWNCISSSLAVMPPSTRSSVSGARRRRPSRRSRRASARRSPRARRGRCGRASA